jgi:hypothetical protein
MTKAFASQADLKPWQDWLNKMVVQGDSKQEKTMRVEFLDATLKNPVAAIDLSGVGIVAIRTPKVEPNADTIARVEIELYAEQVKFSPGGATAAAAGSSDPKTATAAPAETALLESALSLMFLWPTKAQLHFFRSPINLASRL